MAAREGSTRPAGSAGSTGQKKAGLSGRSPCFRGDPAGFAGKSWPETRFAGTGPANDEG